MPLELTTDALKKAEFRGPVRFYDGRGGMARQDFECVAEPRFGYFWQRENRKDKGRQAYTVDGKEVENLDEACRLLADPPAADSPDVLLRQSIDEFHASPPLNYGATRANSEARFNADAGPFGMVRAWTQRADHPWHVGINTLADEARKTGEAWPRWLYQTKTAAHETYRGFYLFSRDRETASGLMCARGVKCAECPILQQIETSMVAARTARFAREITDADIDAAKVWTCISHLLTGGTDMHEGAWSTKEDRESGGLW